MNMNSKKEFGVAVASFAIGAVLAGVLGNTKAREMLLEGSKKLTSTLHNPE
jgi:hypothetical protein